MRDEQLPVHLPWEEFYKQHPLLCEVVLGKRTSSKPLNTSRSFCECLELAFLWGSTVEGGGFWYDVCQGYVPPNLTEDQKLWFVRGSIEELDLKYYIRVYLRRHGQKLRARQLMGQSIQEHIQALEELEE